MKKWIVKQEYNSATPILAQLLTIRGLHAQEQVNEFLNPLPLSELFQRFPIEFRQSLKKAKTVVDECMRENYTIVIHGDYDADGITSTSILYNTLKKELGYKETYFFIPNRFDHGYGVSKKSIEAIGETFRDRKILFITVDSGITAVEETAYIKSLGHKIIITDHHHKPDTPPAADEIVWCDSLVGASVAWIFSRVLGSKNPDSVTLAALATVTDLQPVLGFNRSIVKRGLEIMNSRPLPGLKELLELSRKKEGEVTTYDLGWLIGPRLNASGRLVDASEAVRLFTEDNIAEIKKIAGILHDLNSNRQDITLEMYNLASEFDPDKLPKIIISENEEYHEGIIGLVAARLVQKYYRPAIVISLNENYGKGSVRSVSGINIIEVLHEFEDLFDSLGGHPMAAGFSIKKEKIPEFKAKLTEYAEEKFSEDQFVPEITIDMKMPVNMVSIDLVRDLDKMKPFGLGNEEPVFMSEKLGVIDISYVGKENKHAVLKFFSEGKYFKGVYFNGADDDRISKLHIGDKIDAVYSVKENRFNGSVYVDMIIKDIRNVIS